MYMNFGVLHASLPKKILHLVSYKMLYFTSYHISVYDFLGCIENWLGNYFLMFSPLMREILHAWRDFFLSCGRFYMLAGRAGEIVSRRETPSRCGRVGSPGYTILWAKLQGDWFSGKTMLAAWSSQAAMLHLCIYTILSSKLQVASYM